MAAVVLLATGPSAQASAELFNSFCAACHDDVAHPRGLVFNAAGNPTILTTVISLGMNAGGSHADHTSIAAYLDTIKASITNAPVTHNSPGTVISLRDIKVSGAMENAHLRIIGRIETVSPPAKGTVSYRVALGFTLPSSVVYTPFPGQSGVDTWTYKGVAQNGDPRLDTTVRTASVVIAAPVGAPNYTALWWVPTESGWGINLNHQGTIVFATLFTYDASGAPMWLVMPGGNLQADGTTFSGELFRTTGPAFNANPFTPITGANVTSVGTMSIAFAGADQATLGYTVNGVAVTKSIRRQVYGTRAANCVATADSRVSTANYQDLWWNANESGWGVNVTHQDNTLFATLFTYDAAGRGLWLVMPGGARQADGSFLGDLFRTTGPAFNSQPFTPIGAGNVANVGTMRLVFSDGNTGTLSYTYNGTTVSKAITRQVFSSPAPACS